VFRAFPAAAAGGGLRGEANTPPHPEKTGWIPDGRLEAEAHNAKRGLWADPYAVPPWDFRKVRRAR